MVNLFFRTVVLPCGLLIILGFTMVLGGSLFASCESLGRGQGFPGCGSKVDVLWLLLNLGAKLRSFAPRGKPLIP